ncbi:MAG: hypothetical protein Q8N47_25690 [Bryobacterales bacterium]|nr:hypothetical protein [Bryobacterales bacterium]
MSGNQGDTPVVWSAFTGLGGQDVFLTVMVLPESLGPWFGVFTVGGQQVFLNDGSSQVTGVPNGLLGVNDDRGSGVPEPATIRTLRAALALIALVAWRRPRHA